MRTRTLMQVAAVSLAAAGLTDAAFAQGGNVVVAAPPTLDTWSNHLFKLLDRRISYPAPLFGQAVNTGIVTVKFHCSDTGAPAGVTLFKSSGHRDLDRATLRGVQQIATLHPLPAGLKRDQVFVVRMLYADSAEAAREQIARMQAEAKRNNAWFGKGLPTTAALEIVPTGG